MPILIIEERKKQAMGLKLTFVGHKDVEIVETGIAAKVRISARGFDYYQKIFHNGTEVVGEAARNKAVEEAVNRDFFE